MLDSMPSIDANEITDEEAYGGGDALIVVDDDLVLGYLQDRAQDDEVLGHGELPMGVLETVVRDWIARQ